MQWRARVHHVYTKKAVRVEPQPRQATVSICMEILYIIAPPAERNNISICMHGTDQDMCESHHVGESTVVRTGRGTTAAQMTFTCCPVSTTRGWVRKFRVREPVRLSASDYQMYASRQCRMLIPSETRYQRANVFSWLPSAIPSIAHLGFLANNRVLDG